MPTPRRRAPARPHLTVQERRARGRELRRTVPRSSHAEFAAAPGRPDPVELLEVQARSRVPELVPIRYGRMLVSPFAFFRGAALIMAQDLAGTPRSGLDVQCCGDAHLSNFGVFASPERRLVFDINDFDETLQGPWEWDVKRLAASVLIAGRDNGLGAAQQHRAVLDTVAEYRAAIGRFAAIGDLDVWYAHLDVENALAELSPQLRPRQVKRTKRQIAKARTRDSMSTFAKLARDVDGRVRIVADPPLVVPIDQLAEERGRDRLFNRLQRLLRRYRESLQHDRRVLLERFELADFARKVVGVGSVGTQAWIALLLGRDRDDPLFLQVKQAQPSVLEQFTATSEFDNHGERVVTGQRLMQATSDIFLGWVRVGSGPADQRGDFYGRQLRDWKGSVEIDRLGPGAMSTYGRLCGWTLARAHARRGDRIAIAAYLGRKPVFDEAIASFAKAYADQNERDYRALSEAVESGRVIAERGL
jgi:uncharacterized protein (DUF2252 family)